jgi:hypothetical protein
VGRAADCLTFSSDRQEIRSKARFVLVSVASQQQFRVSGAVNIELPFVVSFQVVARLLL